MVKPIPSVSAPPADAVPDEPSARRRRMLLGGSAASLTSFAMPAQAQISGSDIAAAANAGVTTSPGKAVTVYFDGKRCIHARYCVLGLPAVFLANVKGPWIKPDAASGDDLTHTIRQCPSGALTYKRHDGGREEAPPPVNLVRIRENGPLTLHGDLAIKGYSKIQRATLCRCGASKTKPFCDNSHKDTKFIVSGEAPVNAENKPLAKRDGPLTVLPLPDGPLALTGNFEVVTGTGATIARQTAAIMCRCGVSKTKPYCDGSHVAIGFKAAG